MGKQAVKIVVAGPVNAGKTTLIRSASDVPVVCTNEFATDEVSDQKEMTTVAMDHGIHYLSDSIELHLYGTPGQRRFDFMWEILAIGADALLFVVDGSDPESIEEVKYIQQHFGARITIPEWVVVTRADAPGTIVPEKLGRDMGMPAEQVLACDVRDRQAVVALLKQCCDQGRFVAATAFS